jgi:hypothetical protein
LKSSTESTQSSNATSRFGTKILARLSSFDTYIYLFNYRQSIFFCNKQDQFEVDDESNKNIHVYWGRYNTYLFNRKFRAYWQA